jgi:hypothetical protein
LMNDPNCFVIYYLLVPFPFDPPHGAGASTLWTQVWGRVAISVGGCSIGQHTDRFSPVLLAIASSAQFCVRLCNEGPNAGAGCVQRWRARVWLGCCLHVHMG